jgi:hypothetical protein
VGEEKMPSGDDADDDDDGEKMNAIISNPLCCDENELFIAN